MHFSRLLPSDKGEISGTCVVCSILTEHGHDLPFSDSFTRADLLATGNCVCEHCITLFRDPRYRRSSWVASEDGVVFCKRDALKEYLLSPPRPPFAVYVTESYKVQGWLALKAANADQGQYQVAYDYLLLSVDRERLRSYLALVQRARVSKFTKTELMEGPYTIRWTDPALCREVEAVRKDPLWRLAVYVG